MTSHLQLFVIILLINYAEAQWSWSQTTSACGSTGAQGAPQVSTRKGAIRGSSQTVDGRQYAVFIGIPYAQPPVGQLRFAEPQPMPDSQQCVDASRNFSAICPQADLATGAVSGVEDCLYLNVLSPNTTGRYPVMVWIHGGAFIVGSGILNVESALRILVSKDVVLVSFNYRLGVLGFWSTLTSTVRGNLGFLDQNMALQWVRDNIGQFGGDPSRVTVLGDSAGAASVSAQTLSPLSNGLFAQSIMMSGSMYAFWAMTEDRTLSGLLQKYEDQVGCPQRRQSQWSSQFPDQALVQCMQNASTERLFRADSSTTTGAFSIWTGRVDGKFFPADIPELGRRRPPLPSMIGTTKDEYVALTFIFSGGDPTKYVTTSAQILNQTIPAFISPDKYRNVQLVRQAAAVQYVQLAMSNVTSNSQNYWFSQDNKFKSGQSFWAPSYRDASQYTANGGTVFLYSWDFEMFAIPQLNWKGASHGGDASFLLGDTQFIVPLKSPLDSQITQTVTTMWSNFAKFGNPTPILGSATIWYPLSSALSTNYMSIDVPTTMKQNYRADAVNFWNVVVPSIEANGTQVCAGPRFWQSLTDFYSVFCSVVG